MSEWAGYPPTKRKEVFILENLKVSHCIKNSLEIYKNYSERKRMFKFDRLWILQKNYSQSLEDTQVGYILKRYSLEIQKFDQRTDQPTDGRTHLKSTGYHPTNGQMDGRTDGPINLPTLLLTLYDI